MAAGAIRRGTKVTLNNAKRSMLQSQVLTSTLMGRVSVRPFINKADQLNKPPSAGNESFANGTSSAYFDQMYESWRNDPNSVHSSWRAYFENVEGGA
jgi:2-oxoglutarate dehydrogenase E1 component